MRRPFNGLDGLAGGATTHLAKTTEVGWRKGTEVLDAARMGPPSDAVLAIDENAHRPTAIRTPQRLQDGMEAFHNLEDHRHGRERLPPKVTTPKTDRKMTLQDWDDGRTLDTTHVQGVGGRHRQAPMSGP